MQESPLWTPASSMCCMMPADDAVAAVGQRVDVDLEGVLEEAVDRAGSLLRRRLEGRVNEPAELLVAVDNGHGAAAEHERGPHEQRVAEPLGDPSSASLAGSGKPCSG